MLLLVIARSGNERNVRAIRRPLHVGPFAARAGHVVAERGAVLMGPDLEAKPSRSLEIDHHALDRGDHRVAREGVLPFLQFGMADFRADQIHFADTALVLLKRGDLFRIGRPNQDRAVAAGPSGVIGGVAEVLHAIGGELRFFAAGNVANPEVVIADIRRRFTIRRRHVVASGSTTATAALACPRGLGTCIRRTLVSLYVALPPAARNAK